MERIAILYVVNVNGGSEIMCNDNSDNSSSNNVEVNESNNEK
jgi:hypothetical protein